MKLPQLNIDCIKCRPHVNLHSLTNYYQSRQLHPTIRSQQIPDLFTGRIWTGEQAVKIGLADGYGTVDTVARDVFKAPDILDYTMKENFAERVAKRFGAEAGAAAGKVLVKTPDLK